MIPAPPGWRSRLSAPVVLLGLLAAMGCQPSAASGPAAPAAASEPVVGDTAAGRQLFVDKGCVACHRAPRVAEAMGTTGPNLRGIGNSAGYPKIAGVLDNTPQNVKRFIMDPPANKPGTAMPNLDLSDAEASNLTSFLETLK